MQLLQTSFRRFVSRLLGEPSPSPVEPGPRRPPTTLIYRLETELPESLAVGKGNVLYLAGWCYHPERPIRELAVAVDGETWPVRNHSTARLDVFRSEPPSGDRRGNSLLSGFWAMVPISERTAPAALHVSLQAQLEGGEQCSIDLGSFALTAAAAPPAPLPETTPDTGGAGEPLVVICMTTYNPPLDLLRAQLDSLVRQTHQRWLCVISDDGSRPEIVQRIAELAAGDRRFQLHRQTARVGAYRNFERCLTLVPPGADYVALADQDDDWYPDKLATCLRAFRDDVGLVYSDMHIVTRGGERISDSYWTTRRNNFTSLAALLWANTVTGAASVFRAALLDEILPFPSPIGDAFHDHWIACVALVRGSIAYVDRPLYAYRQHAANVVGHFSHEPHTLVPRGLHGWRWLKAPAALRRRSAASLPALRARHLYLIRIIVLARLLALRLPHAPASKQALLRRFASMEGSGRWLVWEAVRSKLRARTTLGLELLCLRTVIGLRLADHYCRWSQLRLLAARPTVDALASAPLPPEPAPVEAVALIPRKIAPLRLKTVPQAPHRVNILISTIDFRYLFAGYMAMFHLALQLHRHGYRPRLVIVDFCHYDPLSWRRQIRPFSGLEDLFDVVETAYLYDRSLALEVGPRDAFIATSWWTAHIADHAARHLGRERFTFLIQEYEPLFYPAGSLYAMAHEAYALPHRAIFSTDMLRDYFRHHRFGVFSGGGSAGERDSVAIENAVSAFPVDRRDLERRTDRKLLFYARPEPHAARNMFELGILALRQALADGRFDTDKWTFDGIGAVSPYASLPLDRRTHLTLLTRRTLTEYLALLPGYDLGVSLMLSPHPGMTPFDMAAAGLVTVTNTFATKSRDRLAKVSPNLIAVPPTIGGLTAGLAEALDRVEDIGQRIEGTELNWSRDWATTFNADVVAQIRRFLD